jgi:TRAP-type transport system periplasmic protein
MKQVFKLSRRSIQLAIAIGIGSMALGGTPAFAQTKWDLPAAYATGNFHTENLVQFAKDVDTATAGKLKIQVHANASLFKANEIKRAVQGGQAQLGEILLANYANENSLYALDGVPFLAASYGDAQKLYAASKPSMDKALAHRLLIYAASNGVLTAPPQPKLPN